MSSHDGFIAGVKDGAKLGFEILFAVAIATVALGGLLIAHDLYGLFWTVSTVALFGAVTATVIAYMTWW